MIFGFDTETFNGYAKLLTCSNQTYVESTKTIDYINFLYYNASTNNFFYNLGFDFSAMMKQFFNENDAILQQYKKHQRIYFKIFRLEEKAENITQQEKEKLEQLLKEYDKTKLIFKIQNFIITRVGNKSFSIQQEKRRVVFYDIASFYAIKSATISLDKASKLYLNKTKNADELKISAKKIGTQQNYYKNNRIAIIKYCINDAFLTQQLATNLFNTLLSLKIPIPTKFFSKASITKQILNNNKTIIKDTIANKDLPNQIKKIAEKSFFGGLFKLNYIGNFKDVYNLDINSAYPTMIKKLESINNCKVININQKNFKDCFYKFYKIETKANPLYPTKIKGLINYVYSSNLIIYYITEYDKENLDLYKINYNILEGWGIQTTHKKIFNNLITDLYAKKSTAKTNFGKNSYQYSLIKAIANSIYGVFAEKKPTKTKFTNFIYASYITAYCRNYINKLAFKIQNVGGKILTYETDGLVYQLSGQNALKQLNLQSSKKLGEISIEKYKEITIFANGIQQIIYYNNNIINKSRGYPNLNLENLRHLNVSTILSKKIKVKKLDSCIVQHKIYQLNLFQEEEKVFNPYQILIKKYEYNNTIQNLLYLPLKNYFNNNYELTFRTLQC